MGEFMNINCFLILSVLFCSVSAQATNISLKEVSPKWGPQGVETQVTLIGSGFGNSTDNLPHVKIGGLPCKETARISDIELRCKTPAAAQGLVDVTAEVEIEGVKFSSVLPRAFNAYALLAFEKAPKSLVYDYDKKEQGQFVARGGVPPYNYTVKDYYSSCWKVDAKNGNIEWQYHHSCRDQEIVIATDSIGNTVQIIVKNVNRIQLGRVSYTSSSLLVGISGSMDLRAYGGLPPYNFKIVSGEGTINTKVAPQAFPQFIAPPTPGKTKILLEDSDGRSITDEILIYRSGAPDPRDGGKPYMVSEPLSNLDTYHHDKIYRYDANSFLVANEWRLIRVLSNGQVDKQFGTPLTGGITGIEHSNETRMSAVDGNGLIYFATNVYHNDSKEFVIARYLKSGMPDTTFGKKGTVKLVFGDGEAGILQTVIQKDNKLIVLGRLSLRKESTQKNFIFRLNSSGKLDRSFGKNGVINISPTVLYYSPSLKIHGEDNEFLVSSSNQIRRYNKDGKLDNEFGEEGKLFSEHQIISFGINTDNSLLIQSEYTNYYYYAWFSPKGRFEYQQKHGYAPVDSIRQTDGKMLFVADYGGGAGILARFNLFASKDTSFGCGETCEMTGVNIPYILKYSSGGYLFSQNQVLIEPNNKDGSILLGFVKKDSSLASRLYLYRYLQ